MSSACLVLAISLPVAAQTTYIDPQDMQNPSGGALSFSTPVTSTSPLLAYEYNITKDSSTDDDAVGIHLALLYACSGPARKHVKLPPGDFHIKHTIEVPNCDGLVLEGSGGGTRLHWIGSATDVPMFQLNGQTNAEVRSFRIEADNDLMAGIRIWNGPNDHVYPDYEDGDYTPRRQDLTPLDGSVPAGTGFDQMRASTNVRLSHLRIVGEPSGSVSTLDYGVLVAHHITGGENNDFHVFDQVSVDLYNKAAFSIQGGQSKSVSFLTCRCGFQGYGEACVSTQSDDPCPGCDTDCVSCAPGGTPCAGDPSASCDCDGTCEAGESSSACPCDCGTCSGGSFYWYGGGGGNHDLADFVLGPPTDTILISGGNFETSESLLVTTANAAAWPVIIDGVRWSDDRYGSGSVGYDVTVVDYQHRGALIMRGNLLGSASYQNDNKILVDPPANTLAGEGGTFSFVGNALASQLSNPFEGGLFPTEFSSNLIDDGAGCSGGSCSQDWRPMEPRVGDLLTSDATPDIFDVSTTRRLFNVPASSTHLTDLDGGLVGQTVTLRAVGCRCVEHGASSLVLQGGLDFAMCADDTLTLTKFVSGEWTEVGRSENSSSCSCSCS